MKFVRQPACSPDCKALDLGALNSIASGVRVPLLVLVLIPMIIQFSIWIEFVEPSTSDGWSGIASLVSTVSSTPNLESSNSPTSKMDGTNFQFPTPALLAKNARPLSRSPSLPHSKFYSVAEGRLH